MISLDALDANGQGVIVSALFLGEPNLFNTTRDDCYWKRGNERDRCPDKDIRMILFTATSPRRRTEVSFHKFFFYLKQKFKQNYLRTGTSRYNAHKSNVKLKS